MEKYIKKMYHLALKSYKNGDIPVSALVIMNNKVIGMGYNRRYKKHSVIEHAEVMAIISAEKKIKDFRLNGAILITTLKPCSMCYSVIEEARIDKVYYILDQNTNKIYPQDKYIQINYSNNLFVIKYQEIFKNFFKKLR